MGKGCLIGESSHVGGGKKAEGNGCASSHVNSYSLLLLRRLKAHTQSDTATTSPIKRNAVSLKVFWATFHEEKSQFPPKSGSPIRNFDGSKGTYR